MPIWHGNGWLLGMNYGWWIFWVAMLVVVVVLLARRRPIAPQLAATALQILERRYASGEISTQEFDERKAKLLGVTR